MPQKTESQSVGPDPGSLSHDQLLAAGHKAALDCAAKTEIVKAAQELRNTWVVRLYDAGVSQKVIAQTMLVSRARVLQIVAGAG